MWYDLHQQLRDKNTHTVPGPSFLYILLQESTPGDIILGKYSAPYIANVSA